jgi:hypothetical protein
MLPLILDGNATAQSVRAVDLAVPPISGHHHQPLQQPPARQKNQTSGTRLNEDNRKRGKIMTAVLNRPTSPITIAQPTSRRSITDPTLTTAEYNRALSAYVRTRVAPIAM